VPPETATADEGDTKEHPPRCLQSLQEQREGVLRPVQARSEDGAGAEHEEHLGQLPGARVAEQLLGHVDDPRPLRDGHGAGGIGDVGVLGRGVDELAAAEPEDRTGIP
jgi:hypothetical protein